MLLNTVIGDCRLAHTISRICPFSPVRAAPPASTSQEIPGASHGCRARADSGMRLGLSQPRRSPPLAKSRSALMVRLSSPGCRAAGAAVYWRPSTGATAPHRRLRPFAGTSKYEYVRRVRLLAHFKVHPVSIHGSGGVDDMEILVRVLVDFYIVVSGLIQNTIAHRISGYSAPRVPL